MTRVAKGRRLKRQARLVRQRTWLKSFWGADYPVKRTAYLRTLLRRRLKPGMSRILRRMILKARDSMSNVEALRARRTDGVLTA